MWESRKPAPASMDCMGNIRRDLKILTPALRELEEIALLHMDLVDLESARKITDRILDALELLREQPGMGIACRDRILREQGYRMLICGRHICVYRVIAETVYVYHIVDGRTNYPRLLRELSKN